MNVVLILLDSVNRHYLSCYGNDWVQTPNIQQLADRGLVCDNHFIGSAPCMPARRELFTGRKEFIHRGWGQLEPFDANLAKRAAGLGAYTCISTDHYHYWDRSHGYGYIEWFEDRHLVRGQESDTPLAPHVREGDLPAWVRSIAAYRGLEHALRYYRNVMDITSPADWTAAHVMQAAARAIDTNASRDKMFVLAEAFDPHEPFYNLEPYRSLYGPWREDITCWPPYTDGPEHDAFWRDAKPDWIEFIRQQYAANLTMADAQVGTLLDALDRNRLWDDTLVIFTTDHGHELGERRRFGKSYPHYNLNAHIPLIICHPDFPEGRRSGSYSTMVDLHATILDALGEADVACPHGRSLMPVVCNPGASVRDGVLYGTWGAGACWVDDDYTIMSGYDNEVHLPMWYSALPAKLFSHGGAEAGRFIDGVDMPVWRVPGQQRSYMPATAPLEVYARTDGDQQENLGGDTATAAEARARVRAALAAEAAPDDLFARLRLG